MRWAARLAERGMEPEAAAAKAPLFDRAGRAVGSRAQGAADAVAVFVPGRIEVLGKHTDYGGGRSLLCAAERGVCGVGRPRSDAVVTVLDVVAGERVSVPLDPGLNATVSGWGVYVATVVRRLARNFPSARRGCDIAFGSDLPLAAGMSSSSALITSLLLLLAHVNDLHASDAYRQAVRAPEDLAEYLGTIENGQEFRTLGGDAGVGTFGGSEDHVAMLCSRAGALSQYAFCPVRHERDVPVPRDCRFVIGVSGVVAEKTGSARDIYNAASLSARRALDLWNAGAGSHEPTLGAAAAKRGREGLEALPPDLRGRVEQFYEESFDLIPRVGDALAAGRVGDIGPLVDRSQRAAERALGNQVPETIFLARSARHRGALAASAFGAGFGGSVWALVERDAAAAFRDEWASAYATAFPHRAPRAQFFTTDAGPPAAIFTGGL